MLLIFMYEHVYMYNYYRPVQNIFYLHVHVTSSDQI